MKPSLLSARLLSAGILTTVVLGALAPAHAVVLQQKWQAGQTLNYGLTMNGTANLKVPADAPVFFAGVPLEIEVKGLGSARVNTLEVDPMGNGTVYVELPKFDFNASAFGQKALVQLREGEATRFLLNGKPLAIGDKKNDEKTPAKRYGLVVGKDGKIKQVKELDATKLTVAPAQTPALRRVADDQKPVEPGAAIDQGALVTSMILRAMPALLPSGDVKVGDTWKTELPFPAVLAKSPDAAQTAPPLSGWTMTLKAQETVDGVSLWRIGVVGALQVDGSLLPATKAPARGAKPAPQLDNLSQNVNGDLWFDAQSGHFARGEFVIDARGQSHTIDSKGKNSDPSWADFTGTFGMKLNDTK